MGQKVNPHGFRVGVIKNWDSRWFANDSVFGDTLVEDYNLRKYLKKTLFTAGIAKIEIERDDKRVRLHIHCAKPGMVIGRNGSEIEKLRATCQQMLGKPVLINIVEIKNPDANAQLVAENIAAQLEKRISFRRAMKLSIGRAMRLGVKGIKTQVSVAWAALKSQEASSIMREQFRFRPCVPISTTVLPRQTPPTVV